ncbi:MAG: adenosine deaminase [Candidatus Marinimicrobia bacterium]|jgi:adenosine deaminase|nr:adenosine deaminase [Candidatus Neomarinimicrobiota bacterium]MBT3937475.1 adenosine deaminase [Candidatus Neomarinimicrobiota bacterium]MBT3961330.1 adenosine deaminase [Candidatus Neomarinimicrobiota bacterium]MBT4383231.1 adenosine deaminase [Candidatus Neomarinimicrobiota bacterium]MBT4635644.1 adenosine deaminase [Candidatus Neomarinimicrobiota bacterium]
MNISKARLKRLPKVELHCHLDGSIRVPTMIDLAQKDNIKLPSMDRNELKKMLVIGSNRGTLEDYLKRFDYTLSVMQTPESLTRTAFELIEDVSKENVKYIEIRYSPILHTENGMTISESVEAVQDGLKRGEKEFGVQSGIIVCGIRNISPEVSLKLADITVQYKNKGVVGFDLAGAEENYPAKDHREAFYLILNHNINATIHAGEAFGPSSIHQAIHYCGAHRIGHGTRLKEDKDLMQYVNDHRIPLEICLTSNWQTRSIRSLKYHPIKFYYEQGIRVTLNTDNRLMSGTTLTDEFKLANDLFRFSLHDFREFTVMAAKSAFMPHLKRVELLHNIAEEMEQEFNLEPEFIDRK